MQARPRMLHAGPQPRTSLAPRAFDYPLVYQQLPQAYAVAVRPGPLPPLDPIRRYRLEVFGRLSVFALERAFQCVLQSPEGLVGRPAPTSFLARQGNIGAVT